MSGEISTEGDTYDTHTQEWILCRSFWQDGRPVDSTPSKWRQRLQIFGRSLLLKRSWEPRRNVRCIASADWFPNPTRSSNRLMRVRTIHVIVDSGSPTKVGRDTFCLPSPPILRGSMFTFACIAGGLILACTVFALLVPSGPVVTLSDIARRMDTKRRSPRRASFDIACGATTRETKVSRSD